jgi:acyl dehydratase
MTTIIEGREGIMNLIGKPLGVSEYLVIDQARIDAFAAATGDRQWIHTDPARAAKGPYGRTIAHGLLTLSLIGDLSKQVFRFEGFQMGLNYGYDKVRFPSLVPVDSAVRLSAQIFGYEDVPKGIGTLMDITIEQEANPKPACVARMIFRHLFNNAK